MAEQGLLTALSNNGSYNPGACHCFQHENSQTSLWAQPRRQKGERQKKKGKSRTGLGRWRWWREVGGGDSPSSVPVTQTVVTEDVNVCVIANLSVSESRPDILYNIL